MFALRAHLRPSGVIEVIEEIIAILVVVSFGQLIADVPEHLSISGPIIKAIYIHA